MKQILIISLFFLNGVLFSQNIKKTVVRDDNDYVMYNDTFSPKEKTPEKVLNKFKNDLKSVIQLKDATSYKVHCTDKIDAYILVVNGSFVKEAYVLLYNNSNKEISTKNLKINLKWSFNSESGFDFKMMTFPNIKAELSEGKLFLYLKERVHNGNVYNAVITKIFETGEDLSMNLKYCYEDVCLISNDIKIFRKLNENKIISYKNEKDKIDYLGSFIIDKNTGRVISRDCINNIFCEFLITGSNQDEENFLQKGYNFEY